MRTWTDEHKNWIKIVAGLFEQMFGGDFLVFYYDDTYGTKVDDTVTANLLEYSHEHWESHFACNNNKVTHVGNEQFCSPEANSISDTMQSVSTQQPVPPQPPPPGQQPSPVKPQAPPQQPVPGQQPSPAQPQASAQPTVQPAALGQQQVPGQQPSPIQPPASAKSSMRDSSPKAIVIEDESNCCVNMQQADLQVAIAKAKTRAEVAALYHIIYLQLDPLLH